MFNLSSTKAFVIDALLQGYSPAAISLIAQHSCVNKLDATKDYCMRLKKEVQKTVDL